MSRRRPLHRSWAAVLGLAGALAAGSAQASEPFEVVRFSAGSALFAAPGVGRDGSLYVGAGDGYVHALASDGRYRWSYTVKGRIVAAPVEDPTTRRVFVATSEARLYALEPDARLRWVFPLPVVPKTDLTLTEKGTLLFVGRDDYLYGVTTSGALVLRLAAPGARSAPAMLGGGRAGLVLNESLATLKGYGYERSALPGPFEAGATLVVSPEGAVFSCEEGRARVQTLAKTELAVASDCLSPPVRGDGFFAIAEANDAVRLLYPSGRAVRLPLGASPLRPSWDAPRRRLVLATANGSVSVLELPAAGTVR